MRPFLHGRRMRVSGNLLYTYIQITGAALCIAHAFVSTHPQSYVIAHNC